MGLILDLVQALGSESTIQWTKLIKNKMTGVPVWLIWYMTLGLGIVSLSPSLDVEPTKNKIKILKNYKK